MKDELRFLGMSPLFGFVGAAATAASWQVFAATLIHVVPDQLAVLSCLVAGLVGPLVVWGAVHLTTRGRRTSLSVAVRNSASVGLGLTVTAELGFYIPLGIIAIAFQ